MSTKYKTIFIAIINVILDLVLKYLPILNYIIDQLY